MEKSKRTLKRRLLPFLFLYSLCLCFVSFGPGQELVSNVDGKIQVVILHYARFMDVFWFDQTVLYHELLEKMDKDVGFVILLGTDERAGGVKEVLKRYAGEKLPDGTSRVKFLGVDVKSSQFYPWSRDPYFILAEKSGRILFLDAGFNEKPFPVTRFQEVFADAVTLAGTVHRGGGNIRTTEEAIFVGMDTILGSGTKRRYALFGQGSYDNLYETAMTLRPKDLPAYREKFDAHAEFLHQVLAPRKKLVIPEKEIFFEKLSKGKFEFKKKTPHHTGAQAAYHTDVYLGLGHKEVDGKRVLFVADSRAGAQIAKGLSPEKRRAVERDLPQIIVEEGLTAVGVPVTAEQAGARFEWERRKLIDRGIEEGLKLAETLDKAAAYLEKQGFRIVRIPCLPNGLLDDADEKNDALVGIAFNYSNVLTEVYGDVKKVYLPQFGFREMDEAAASAYRSAGFQPVFIKGLLTNALSQIQAGLDCLTSEIRFPVRWTERYYKENL